jgi:WD40 repeat protein/tetratricopeptide (TPR) repeat protein
MVHNTPVGFASFGPDGLHIVTECQSSYRKEPDLIIGSVSSEGSFAGFDSSPMLWNRQRGVLQKGDHFSVWQILTDVPIGTYLDHRSRVFTSSVSPDGRFAATGGLDDTPWLWGAITGGAAHLWDATTGRSIGPPLKHWAWVNHVAFSRDSRLLVSSSEDRTAQVLDVATGKLVTPPLKHPAPVNFASFSTDGRLLVTVSNHVERWPYRNNYLAETTPVPLPNVECLGEARVWDLSTGQPVSQPLRHRRPLSQAVFSPDGQRVVTASDDGTAQVWGTTSGQALGPPLEHHAPVQAVAFSPDGSLVATAGADGVALLWDAKTSKAVTPRLRHGNRINLAAFNPRGDRLVTASDDSTARIWNVKTGEPATEVLRHDKPVSSASFSLDGLLVATLSDQTVRLWDARSGVPVSPPLNHEHPLNHVSFLDSGQGLATAGSDFAWTWSLRPCDKSLDVLGPTAQLLSGRRLDMEKGLMVYLTEDQFIDTWKAVVSSAQPVAPAASPEQVLAWHRHESQHCMWDDNAIAALSHFDYLVAAEPKERSHFHGRAQAFSRVEKWEQARDDYLAALELQRAQLGDVHHEVADTLRALGEVYEALKQDDDAERCYKQAADIYRTRLGPGHPTYARSLHNLGWHYVSRREIDKAEPLFRETLEILLKVLPHKHIAVLETQNTLAGCLATRKAYAEAAALLLKSYKILNPFLDGAAGDRRTKAASRAVQNLVRVY